MSFNAKAAIIKTFDDQNHCHAYNYIKSDQLEALKEQAEDIEVIYSSPILGLSLIANSVEFDQGRIYFDINIQGTFSSRHLFEGEPIWIDQRSKNVNKAFKFVNRTLFNLEAACITDDFELIYVRGHSRL